MNFQTLKIKYQEIANKLENGEGDADELLDELQNDFENTFDEIRPEQEMEFSELKRKFKQLDKEYNSFPYDEEEELDRMFPNRHDDDFDGDNMNF